MRCMHLICGQYKTTLCVALSAAGLVRCWSQVAAVTETLDQHRRLSKQSHSQEQAVSVGVNLGKFPALLDSTCLLFANSD
jgi:hypothetical protein